MGALGDRRVSELVRSEVGMFVERRDRSYAGLAQELQDEKNERARECSELRMDFKRDVEAERTDRIRMCNGLEVNFNRALTSLQEERISAAELERISAVDTS